MRLIVKDPDTPNTSVNRCNACPPTSNTPNHKCSPIAPSQVATASRHTRRNDVGIGVPSKKVTFPTPAERVSAVTS
jgi:hypothetical protein